MIRAAQHNSARGSSERFCPKIKFGKRRNTLCISSFSNCKIGAKDPPLSADAIMRCCLKKKLFTLLLAFAMVCSLTACGAMGKKAAMTDMDIKSGSMDKMDMEAKSETTDPMDMEPMKDEMGDPCMCGQDSMCMAGELCKDGCMCMKDGMCTDGCMCMEGGCMEGGMCSSQCMCGKTEMDSKDAMNEDMNDKEMPSK